MSDEEGPIILEARCDQCSRFVKVAGVWLTEEGAVTGVDAICAKHGRRRLPAECYIVWWPGE